jgi:DNA invertase Pin-like site-specific DNA recombinase
MKAAVYLRVSTKEQDTENQGPDCLRICQQRGWESVFFRDEMSGAKTRPGWEAVKLAVHRGEVGAVVIWALDRAGRNRAQLCHDIAELGRKGAVVVSVRESWLDQPMGPMRDLLLQIMAWVAEGERGRLIERTAAGIEGRKRLVAEGRTWVSNAGVERSNLGRPPVKVDVERARALLSIGKSRRATAAALGVSRGAMDKALGWSKNGGQNGGQKVAENRPEPPGLARGKETVDC